MTHDRSSEFTILGHFQTCTNMHNVLERASGSHVHVLIVPESFEIKGGSGETVSSFFIWNHEVRFGFRFSSLQDCLPILSWRFSFTVPLYQVKMATARYMVDNADPEILYSCPAQAAQNAIGALNGTLSILNDASNCPNGWFNFGYNG
jgi:hypothetical protein